MTDEPGIEGQGNKEPRLTDSWRVSIAACVIVCAMCLSAWRTLQAPRPPDEVSRFEGRFQSLRSRIPATDKIGLLTNLPASDAYLQARELYVAQYALAPAIIVRGKGSSLVLGDFYAERPPLPATDLEGLEPLADLGHGIVLYRKVAK